MARTYRGHNFEFIQTNNWSAGEIRRIGVPSRDASVAYLQGDDASEIMDELDRIEEFDYPRGPFADAGALIDAVLSGYDA